MNRLGHFTLLATLVLLALVSAQPRALDMETAEKAEVRCGWFSNPTPANASLHDRDDEWIIGVQVRIKPKVIGRTFHRSSG